MYLKIYRREHRNRQTLGELYIIDEETDRILFQSRTLELPYIDNKTDISCVPVGRYKCKLEYSGKFKKLLWELKDVPNRTECKFHSANYFHQLNGCIALGDIFADIDGDGWRDVLNSTETMVKFHNILKDLKEVDLYIM
jgi:hypothetical protein